MAPSLQVLIDFLLAEIALCGDQGASLSDIFNFTIAFYAKPDHDPPQRTHSVDRRFHAKVWSWLTRHPEVSVGRNREANHLSFDDVEHDPRAPRVFVSEERTWLAIAGHEPDETKVLPTEFALLSIIALGKANGIPQTDLVRLSGQDKRSVPKRTDVLQQKGYIQKRAIQLKSTRTSLCTLCKFLKPEYLAGQASADQQHTGAAGPENRVIDFKVFTDKLFDILREYKIIARNDLKSHLGFSDAWRWKVLSRALRKFERIGVLKRVKAMSQYQDTVNKYHPCVMLLRDPSERDLELFHEFSRNLFSSLGQKGDVDEPDEDYEEEPERANAGTVSVVKREESVEEAGRLLPTWTPDRNLHHIILDRVDAAGLSGINNHGIVRGCFGAFFRRPLENTMARLVECWQLSQPPHLRHLAIIRDTVLRRTNAMYLHYSIRNFKVLVDAGEASWEAVEFVPKGGSSNKFRVPPVDAVPQLDEYGFPLPHSPGGLLKNGNATLLECIASCKPADYTRSSSDPIAVRLKDGSYTFRLGSYKLSSDGTPSQQSPSGRPRGRPRGTANKPKLELQDPDDDDHQPAEIMEATTIRSLKKSKRAQDRLEGLSEKEKLEALGMDDSWTEYSVLSLERTNPGVYVTPRGRRRPLGKSRGRPRVSQLAVFKSTKLASLPWFTAEKDGSEDAVSISPSREHSVETPVVSRAVEAATPSRGAKRTFQTRESEEEASTPTSSVPRRGRKPKQMRRDHDVDRQDDVSTPRSQRETRNALATVDAPENRAKRKRQQSPSVDEVRSQVSVPNGEDVADATRSKKLRRGNEHDTGTDAGLATTDPVEPSAGQLSEVPAASSTTVDIESTAGVNQGQATEPPEKAPESKQQGKRGRTDRSGSVAVLRRKIIIDVIKKAGGAFPMGTELWYPFTTAWMKTKFKEKPDMRTLRTSVKNLIDAGKLRQQTFSGRDSKGVMVTKSIVTLPETLPDQPVVKEMEAKMLAEGNRFYFPPNTDINPELTKSGAIGAVKRELKPISQLPVETGLTVQLQQKPALVLAKEKKIQRQLLERLEFDEDLGVGDHQSKVDRLMTIQRRPADNLTSIARPGGGKGRERAPAVPGLVGHGGGALRRAGKMRRLRTSMQPIAPYAMFMDPRQTFNPVNGTFSTDAGLAATARRLVTRARAPPALSTTVPYAMLMNPKQTFNPTTGTFGTNGNLMRWVLREKSTHDLPESLEALFGQTQRHVVDPAKSADQRTSQFFRDNDEILQWELENQKVLLERNDSLRYLNQTIPDVNTMPIEGSIRFDIDQPVPRVREPREPITTRRRAARRSGVSADNQPQQERRLEKLNESITSSAAHKSTTLRQPLRRNRSVATLPPSFVQRVMTAIVVVRVLAGGAEGKMVDWPLVARCFPGHDPRFLQDRARNLLNRNRLQIVKMQGDFQERFIEAYASGQVPSIDYNDLDAYDWEGVVEWAQTQLDVPSSEKLPDLPATREQFDSVFELREETPASLDEIFQNTLAVTFNRKRTLFASTPFAEPLPDSSANKPEPKIQHKKQYLDRLNTAKTWVRANVITPEESYRPVEARQSLERFGDALITDAVHALVAERVIKMGNRGRITPGRNYDITEPFINALRRRAIDSTQLYRAAVFKTTVLDPRFREHGGSGVFEVDYNADDGDILALINLAAERKVVLKPRDPPRDKYGLTEGGYLTRQMDKRKLRFAVDVLPVDQEYVFGNPIANAPAPPRPPSLTPAQEVKIPLWLDIHGCHSSLVWDLVSAAVVGCVASRPGISARGIASMVRPAAAAWEIEVLLGWMERVGIVRPCGRGHGWVVKEWWWMVLGVTDVL